MKSRLTILFAISIAAAPAHAGNQYKKLFKQPAASPMQEFMQLQSAAKSKSVKNMSIAALATFDKANMQPFNRTMHVSKVTSDGFLTNAYDKSLVSQHIKDHNKASLLYLWQIKPRKFIQIQINGTINKVGPANARSQRKDLKEGYNAYLLKPTSVVFTLANKKHSDIVDYSHIIYTKDKSTWRMRTETNQHAKVTP